MGELLTWPNTKPEVMKRSPMRRGHITFEPCLFHQLDLAKQFLLLSDRESLIPEGKPLGTTSTSQKMWNTDRTIGTWLLVPSLLLKALE